MKEQVLSAADRDALQSIVNASYAVGAGAIFASFFLGRRNSGLATFEIFTVVAILAGAGTTAYFCISFLHENEVVSDADLTRTSTPLLVSILLLVFISVFSRLSGPPRSLVSLIPMAIGAAVGAALLGSSTWMAQPEDASWVALSILAFGGCIGLAVWAVERSGRRSMLRAECKQLARLAKAGYSPREATLGLALPEPYESAAALRPTVWVRKSKVCLEPRECRRLGAAVDARWEARSAGRARPPIGSRALAGVRVRRRIPRFWADPVAVLTIHDPAQPDGIAVREVDANEVGLFDVSGIGIV